VVALFLLFMKARDNVGCFPKREIMASYRNLHLEMMNLSRHAIYKTGIIKNNFSVQGQLVLNILTLRNSFLHIIIPCFLEYFAS